MSRNTDRVISSVEDERYRIQTRGGNDIAREWIPYEPARLRRIGARRTGVINQFHLACSIEALDRRKHVLEAFRTGSADPLLTERVVA